MSPAEALRMYTLGGACSLAREATLGSLGVGKFADFIALADDPLAVPPDRIADSRSPSPSSAAARSAVRCPSR